MEKIRVFRGFYPIIGIASVLVLLIVGVLSLFNLQYRISSQQGLIKEHIQSTIYSLQKAIAPTVEQGDAIRKSAEYYLNNSEIQSDNLYYKYLQNSEVDEFEAYDMDSLPEKYHPYIGNVTGLGTLETLTQNEVDQINMAIYVSPLLSSLKNNQESITLTYYLSPQVCMLYPYPKSSDFRLSPEVASHIPETNGVVYPEKNPDRKHAWTDIYSDDVGNGLMVTGLFPVYKGDTFLGSLGFDFTLNNLNQIISNSQLDIGENFIVNNNQVLAHPRLVSSEDSKVKLLEDLDIEKQYITDIIGFQDLQEETFHFLDHYILYYQKIPLTPWYSVYFVDKPTFYFSAFKDSARNLLIVFFSLIVVLLLTAWFTKKKFITPASLLVKHIQTAKEHVVDPNQTINKVPEEWRNWFTIVSDTFKKNREMVNELKENNEQLEQKVAERTAEVSTQNEELIQQQEEILSQRDAIEQQNNDLSKASEMITKSIDAAQIIQKAMLPSKKRLQTLLKEFFVFNKPRDVVSGDFYWIDKVDNKTVIVVADCTGHGVPGAFMTLIGITMLDRIVNLNKTLSPQKILSALHDGIHTLLKQEERESTNVGMDAAIIVLETANGQTTINYAGAKIPLICFDQIQNKIVEIKPSRKSIGGYQNKEKEYISHEFSLPKDSIVYLGSDGLADQNNEKRRSLGRKAIIEHLQNNAQLSLEAQGKTFETLLENQMVNTTQRDDILWIGLKL